MDAARPISGVVNQVKCMQPLLESLTAQELNVVLSMVDLDCLDWTPTIEELIDAIEMFGYSEQDVIDRVMSTNEFVFLDEELEADMESQRIAFNADYGYEFDLCYQ